MITFEKLRQPLQDFLTDPRSNVFVVNFLKLRKKDTPDKIAKVSDLINQCIYGEISTEEMMTEIGTFCNLNETESSRFFLEFLEILGEEGLEELDKYPVNQEGGQMIDMLEQSPIKTNNQQNILPRNPEVVQSKLLQALDSFNLHVDEKGIVAYEVERYLKGEILSRDLVPHLTAMLDKPLSEINAIVSALNTQIFKPIQKQIAEEGTLDISYDDDVELKNFLIQKKGFGSASPVTQKEKKIDIKKISFLPKEVLKTISQQKKDELVIDLRSQGGTPSGTSLLSEEVQKEQKEIPVRKVSQQTQDTISKKYTIDPYREIPE